MDKIQAMDFIRIIEVVIVYTILLIIEEIVNVAPQKYEFMEEEHNRDEYTE